MNQGFLDAIKLGELHIDSLPSALKILCALSKVLATFNARGSDCKCAL